MAPKRTAQLLFKGDLPDGRRYELVVLGGRVLLEFYSGTRRLNKVHVPKESGLEWATERLGVPREDIPHGLLDALLQAGEMLQTNTVPCAKLFLVPPFKLLTWTPHALLAAHAHASPQVHLSVMAIILGQWMLMNQQQVRSFCTVH